jgi:hypothetical protein
MFGGRVRLLFPRTLNDISQVDYHIVMYTRKHTQLRDELLKPQHHTCHFEVVTYFYINVNLFDSAYECHVDV